MLFDIVRPSEVSDEVPTMKPTSAQASATPSAPRAPSARASTLSRSDMRVCFLKELTTMTETTPMNPAESGLERRVFHQQSGDDDKHGDEQMSVAFHNLAHDGKLFLPYPFEMVTARADVDVAEYRGVIDERGDDRGSGYRKIGYVEKLAHDEGPGPHDGRHQLAAGRGAGFDRARVVRRVADLFHERYPTEEPFIVPSSPEATTATLAGPPGLPPASASASSLKNFAPPLLLR